MAIALDEIRQTVSNWFNDLNIEIPWDKAFIIWDDMDGKVDIEHLCPRNPANKRLKNLKTEHKRHVFLSDIIENKNIEYLSHQNDETIILDQNLNLIHGWAKLQKYKLEGQTRIYVTVLNTKKLSACKSIIKGMSKDQIYSTSVYLEKLLKESPDIKSLLEEKSEKFLEKGTSFGQNFAQAKATKRRKKTKEIIAKLLNTNYETLRSMHKIYPYAIPELIDAINHNQISIDCALKLITSAREDNTQSFEQSQIELLNHRLSLKEAV